VMEVTSGIGMAEGMRSPSREPEYPEGVGPDFRDQPPPEGYDISALPELYAGQFPPNARTENEKLRFRACWKAAHQMFPDSPENAWLAARSLYNSPEITF
jgi:hypothetical protein